MGLLQAAERSIRRHAMLAPGDGVVVGVSGGADSVALLRTLHALAPAWRLSLHVLHVDHRLRSDSAAAAAFVQSLARGLGLPVTVVTVEVGPRGSREAAARAARYRALERHAERVGADRIALGHTADDQTETVLMRLLSGAGLRGLAGIPPVRGRVIRPLLGVRRTAIEDELRRLGVTWIEDPTNRDVRFTRNRIRHRLLPLLARAQPGAVGVLDRLARLARDTTTTLDTLAARELERLAREEPDAVTLPRSALAALPRPLGAEVLRQAAVRLGSGTPLRAWAYRGLARVLGARPPRRLRLDGATVEVSGDCVRIGRRPVPVLAARRLSLPGRLALPEAGLALEATVRPASGYVVPADRERVAFDADALPPVLVVRARRPGDRFAPFGAVAERRLKTLLIDARVPRWARGLVPLVEAEGRIVWVGGLRRSAAAPVSPTTRRVVELTLIPLVDGPAAR